MDNLKIYCKRIKYFDSVDYSDVNLFNRTGIDTYTNKTELTDILDISTIKYEQASVMSGDTLELIKKCNDISFVLGTIRNTNKEFFKVKSNEKKYLYLFFVKYDNELIFTGVSTQENITYLENPTPESERINIQVKTLTSHFLEYNKPKFCDLNEMESTFNKEVIYGGEYKSADIEPFIRKFFFNNDIAFSVVNHTGYNWEVNRQPFFYISVFSNDTYNFITNGFRKMAFESISKTDFFIKLCNAMGWDFYLRMDFNNETIFLELYNRSRTTIGMTISTDKINSINYSSVFDLSDVDYVVIKDGLIKGGSGYATPQGVPVKIISLKETYSNRGYFFQRATYDPSHYTLYPRDFPNYYMIGNVMGAGDILDFGKVRFTDSASWGSRQTEDIHLLNRNILYIDTGENAKGTLVDMATKTMTMDADNLGESKNDVYFKGNYGSMLMIKNNSTGNYSNYDDYSTTSQYSDNFKILLKNKDSDIIDVVYNGIIKEYYNNNIRSLTFMTGDTYLDRTWDIVELELEPVKKQTKLKLKLKI